MLYKVKEFQVVIMKLPADTIICFDIKVLYVDIQDVDGIRMLKLIAIMLYNYTIL
jgi:hypothetical protein